MQNQRKALRSSSESGSCPVQLWCEGLFHIKGEYEIYFFKVGGPIGNRHHPVLWLSFPLFRLQVLSYNMILKSRFPNCKKNIMN